MIFIFTLMFFHFNFFWMHPASSAKNPSGPKTSNASTFCATLISRTVWKLLRWTTQMKLRSSAEGAWFKGPIWTMTVIGWCSSKENRTLSHSPPRTYASSGCLARISTTRKAPSWVATRRTLSSSTCDWATARSGASERPTSKWTASKTISRCQVRPCFTSEMCERKRQL